MDKNLETLLELCRDPMLAVEQRKVLFANTAARLVFPGLTAGGSAAGLIPDHILLERADSFVTGADLAGKQYTVSCANCGGTRVLALVPRSSGRNGPGGLLSDGLISNLLSTLFNVGLAADRISTPLEAQKDAHTARYLAILRHGYYSLRRQLSNLNMAIQLREGTAYLAPRRIDLVEFCADLAASVSAVTGGNRPGITFSAAQEELSAMVDPTLLERLLLNLLSNSLAHTPKDGEIRMRLSQSGENAVIAVDDNGEGIPAELLQNIFARYEARLDGAHLDRAATAGLGLGVASGIAKLHGGALIIESREGQGTSVRTMLPLAQADAEQLESGPGPESRGMDGILTELSGLLDYSFYTQEYLD